MGSVNFYTVCMNNSTISPGFVADKAELAGNAIEGLGHVFMWAGDLFTKYGFSGGMLASFGYAIGKVAALRGAQNGITDMALDRLKENGGAFAIGCVLAAIGGPVKYIGYLMQTRDIQCKIGNFLTLNSKVEV